MRREMEQSHFSRETGSPVHPTYGTHEGSLSQGVSQRDREPEHHLLSFFLYAKTQPGPISPELKAHCLGSVKPGGRRGYLLGLVAEEGHAYVAKDQIQVEPGRKDL